ncbi:MULTISPECIES: spore coat protein [Bacillaceae]|uniref:spore coat protein n=1 Tax=Bacillaceae TaxID=186817 RepID=UPI001E473352|nr:MULTISPECIES: spore coat protein [Bacillaceae]MCE4048608.1 spore coat protein [Bacillus sp. Au-Bac7]UPO89689.1 spore coat protein [Niallia sp. Man26]
MNGIMQNLIGLGDITDQVIATDLLISAKSGIRNYAFAITEAATPEVRCVLNKQLHDAIDLHGKISDYMVANGYYHPSNVNEQLNVDLQTTDTALSLPNKQDK